MSNLLKKFVLSIEIIINILKLYSGINKYVLLNQLHLILSTSLSVTIIAAFFMGLVFSLQIVKEFLYLNAITLIGSILSISFLRELSPILTSIILIGKIGSFFTAELATMNMTEQVDALYILGIDPINYLIKPRILAFIFVLPLLNFISFITSLFSSSFICYILYNIDPKLFFTSVFSILSWLDLIKSIIKMLIFAFFISLISCVWGLTSQGGAEGVGKSTTSAVVISLISVFILDFILSYYMFDNVDSSLKIL